jgi:transcriptional regulator with XRE-family HTH domain
MNSYRGAYLLTIDGAELTKARVAAGLRGEDVATRLGDGANKSTVSRWEQGQLQPSQERLFALVELFGTHSFVRLNGKAALTREEIDAVRKLREG